MGWLVAVHVGAGRYGTADEAAYLDLMRRALQCGKELLAHTEDTAGATAADDSSDRPTTLRTTACSHAALVASRMLRVFERDERTNAGLGANLTENGIVECEASVACGKTRLVSACASVRGVAEPSALAHALLEQAARVADLNAGHGPLTHEQAGANNNNNSNNNNFNNNNNSNKCNNAIANAADARTFAFGREPPLVVVGDHARVLARQFGIDTASSDNDDDNSNTLDAYQVTPQARTRWRKWHAQFSEAGSTTTTSTAPNELLLDTVGAICIDNDGNVAAALSSGGIAYKVPGRVGLAGSPRMGCDAANAQLQQQQRATRKRKRKRSSVALQVTRSGCAVAGTGRGEHFVRSGLIAKLTHKLRKRAAALNVERALRTAFNNARDDNGSVAVEGGVLALAFAPIDSDGGDDELQLAVQLGVAFSTPCMGVGFAHSGSNGSARVQILRQPHGDRKSSQQQQQQQLSTHVSFLSL